MNSREAKILVTGGAGFIGSHLTRSLAAAGNRVVVYDNFSTGSMKNLRPLSDNPRVEIVNGDLFNETHLRESLKSCRTVYHLAASRDVRIGRHDTETDLRQNVIATHNLLDAIKDSGCKRIVFTSTSTVYGEPTEIPTPESYGPLKPLSLYGASKLACEALITSYCHLFGINATILRLANVVGPESDHGVVFDLVVKALTDPHELIVLGNGSQQKSYLHIDDCISALEMFTDSDDSEPEIVNVGALDSVTVREIVKIIKQSVGFGVGLTRYSHNGDGRGWAGDVMTMLLDCRKLLSKGWKANYTSAEAVESCTRQLVDRLKEEPESAWTRAMERVVRTQPNSN